MLFQLQRARSDSQDGSDSGSSVGLSTSNHSLIKARKSQVGNCLKSSDLTKKSASALDERGG